MVAMHAMALTTIVVLSAFLSSDIRVAASGGKIKNLFVQLCVVRGEMRVFQLSLVIPCVHITRKKNSIEPRRWIRDLDTRMQFPSHVSISAVLLNSFHV